MPQASEAQCAKWGGQDGVGEDKAIKFLESAGFVLNRNWTWQLPSPTHQVTQDEYEAVRFLVDEWDFGGFVTGGK